MKPAFDNAEHPIPAVTLPPALPLAFRIEKPKVGTWINRIYRIKSGNAIL
jgi:hypothetical protein